MDFNQEIDINEHASVIPPKSLVMIATNTGGPRALSEVIPKLSRDLPACVVVMVQMRPGFTSLLARELSTPSSIEVCEAEDGMVLEAGRAVIVPGGWSAQVIKRETIKEASYRLEIEDTSDSADKRRVRIDQFMQSGATAFGSSSTGVLLTGAGDDGRGGLRAVCDAYGCTIVQDALSSIIFEMPKAAIDGGVAQQVLPLFNIPDRIIEIVRENNGDLLQKAAG